MFVFDFRVTRSKKMFIFFAVASILTALICIFGMMSMQNGFHSEATCDEIGTYSLKAENFDRQCDFLGQFGLKADEITDSTEIVIPAEFNDTYEEYNELQKRIGLDLEAYKGKPAEKITYKLNNSKIGYAVLLVCNGYVIGGHLTNGEYGSKNMPLNNYGKT